MKKSILVTGVSGAGKSALSKKLNEMGYKAYDIDDYPGLFSFVDKKTGKPPVDIDNANVEKVMGTDWICDKEKLTSIIANESSEITFYCGAASNVNDLLPLFDLVILLKIGTDAMRHRLNTRTENDAARHPDVQDWILTWKNEWENGMQERGAVAVDAHQSLDKVAKEVIRLANEAMDRGAV
jgi:broad-specificity NMP kinase